jgi:hypothetical protein
MCHVGTFTELAVGVGEGPLFGVGVGDGEDAFTPPHPATASAVAAAAIMIAIFWRRSDGREEKIWEVMSNVELAATFMARYPFQHAKVREEMRILRFLWRFSRDQLWRPLIYIGRDAAALDRDALA